MKPVLETGGSLDAAVSKQALNLGREGAFKPPTQLSHHRPPTYVPRLRERGGIRDVVYRAHKIRNNKGL